MAATPKDTARALAERNITLDERTIACSDHTPQCGYPQ